MNGSSVDSWTGTSSLTLNDELPWLLSLAKSTALLAGRLASTLLLGDSAISPFLERHFTSPLYSCWLQSDLLMGGCDPLHETSIMQVLGVASEDGGDPLGHPRRETTANEGSDISKLLVSTALPSQQETSHSFLEEVGGGYGRGGFLVSWLQQTHCASNPGYRLLKRQAKAGRDGRALEAVERSLLATLLHHGSLVQDAILFTRRTETPGNTSPAMQPRTPPQRFRTLWKKVAEVRALFV